MQAGRKAEQLLTMTGGKGTLKCSATSQDSKAEYSREVATPQKILPTSRMWKLFQCFVKQPKAYVAT